MTPSYVGRFAPSPTGPLHAGSLATALASWLDARAHGGRWLVRIEDVDAGRCPPGMGRVILQQLEACGLIPDGPVVLQSHRGTLYQAALDRLVVHGLAYPCACSRREIAAALAARGVQHRPGEELGYPGTCRPENGGLRGRPPRSWRFHSRRFACMRLDHADAPARLHWHDRRLGQQPAPAGEIGDFILRRADRYWAYQLAVVVDDAAQGVTHVVRGEDLTPATTYQLALQLALRLPRPVYLHTPLVYDADGRKLSKQNGARAIDPGDPGRVLAAAAQSLDLVAPVTTDPPTLLRALILQWRARYG